MLCLSQQNTLASKMLSVTEWNKKMLWSCIEETKKLLKVLASQIQSYPCCPLHNRGNKSSLGCKRLVYNSKRSILCRGKSKIVLKNFETEKQSSCQGTQKI